MLRSQRAALSALKQRQRGCQTYLRQEQKHLFSEGASWEFPYNWVPSAHYQLGESREARTKGEKKDQSRLFSLVSRNSPLQRGIGVMGREKDAIIKERTRYDVRTFSPVTVFFFLFMKLLRRIHLFFLHCQTESQQACTPTFPNQSPSSQMHWEGTEIPCLPNIIIPIQAGAAWKSTFTAH